MVTWGRSRRVARVVLALYVLAAITFGFAHRRINFEPSAPPVDLAAYALPDGDLPVLCRGKNAPANAHKVCDACALASAPGLPTSTALGVAAPDHGAIARLRIPPDASGSANEPDNVRSRAPPMQPVVNV